MNARKLRTAIVNFEKEHKQFQVTRLILVDKSEFPEFQNYLEEHENDFKTLSKPENFECHEENWSVCTKFRNSSFFRNV